MIDVSAAEETLLASSEKLTPELRVTIDGREAAPVAINALFAAVRVPAGNHRVVFSRRVGRGWWGWSGLAFGLFVIASVVDLVVYSEPRRRLRIWSPRSAGSARS